ncbi:MAG: hypothetical protein AAF939_06265 [Planctomycetota bacterium]
MANQEENKISEIKKWDQRLAIPMFCFAFAFLLVLAAIFHLVDGDLQSRFATALLVILGVLWIPMILETALFWSLKSNQMRQHLIFILCPVMRLCPSDHITGEDRWIVGLGWRRRTAALEHYLYRIFSAPMIVIAISVLPVVGMEFFYSDYFATAAWLKYTIFTCSGLIWTAFAFEFVVMISVAEKKLNYCRVNWIDLAIVFLPIVSYLGAARMGRLLKLKQLTRTAKIYRMRGLALRTWRALLALDVIDMVLRRTPEAKMDRIEELIKEKEKEIAELKEQLSRVQAKNNQNASSVETQPE